MSKDGENVFESSNASDDSISSRKRGRPRKKNIPMISDISNEEKGTNGVAEESTVSHDDCPSKPVSSIVHNEDRNSRVTDTLNNTVVPRRRGRPPKSKVTLVFSTAQSDGNVNNLSCTPVSIVDRSENLKLSNTISTENDGSFFDCGDTPRQLVVAKKRGRPPKLKSSLISKKALRNETNCHPDDTCKEIVVPRKNERPRKRKCSPVSKVAGNVEIKPVHDCDHKCEPVEKEKKGQLNMSVNSKENLSCESKSEKAESVNQMKLFPIFNSPGMSSKKCDSETTKVDEKCKSPRLIQNGKRQMTEFNNIINNSDKSTCKSGISQMKSQRMRSAKSDLRSFVNRLNNAVDAEPLNGLCTGKTKSDVTSNNTEDDVAVSDVIEYMCLQVQELINCHDKKVQSSNDNHLPLKELSLSAKHKKNSSATPDNLQHTYKSEQIPVTDNICNTINLENNLELSGTRKSLRIRSVKSKLINYSEIDSLEKSQKPEKGLAKRRKQSKDVNDNSEKSNKVCNTVSLKQQENSENWEKKIKLFPIFTPKVAMSDETDSKQSSCKRKAPCDEVLVEDNVKSCIRVSNIKMHSAKPECGQRSIRLSKVGDKNDFKEQNVTSDHLIVLDVNIKSSKVQSTVNKQIEESHSMPTSKVDDEIFIKECKKVEKNNSHVTSLEKSNKYDGEIQCFPKLSHLNVIDDSLLNTVNKFNIYEDDSCCNITVPSWNEVKGFVDANCAMMIKNLGSNCSETERKFSDSLNSTESSTNTSGEKESVLWTDSSQNSVTKEKVNETTVNQIKSWLLEWRDRFCRNSEKKPSCSDSDDYSSSDSDDDFISNSIIIHGVPGSGKTSLVFSLANELGFKVLEVNASSSRSGRNISHQLKEALESYHMESIKIDDACESTKSETKMKESKSSCSAPDAEKPKGKTKNIKSFFEVRSNNVEKKSAKCNGKKQSIANFFQVSNDSKKESNSKPSKNNSRTKLQKACDEISEDDLLGKLKSDKSSYRISSLTIILFDDVDIVFEEDDGFWSTVRSFLKISKKPVIFTVGRNLSIVRNMLNSDIQIFNMIPSSKETAIETLKSYCKIHSRESTTTDLKLLTSQNPSDLRRNILNAQFWTANPRCSSNKFSSIMSDSRESPTKFVHTTTFLVGDFNFSADHVRKLLFDQTPCHLLNTVQEYHSLGYDVLYNNLFDILGILDSAKHEKVWTTFSNNRLNKAKTFSDSQMWEEACEIFKQKKAALESGSSSADLIALSDMAENFSFADLLKGVSSSEGQWIPVSERIKLWTAGLPICSDYSLQSCDEILQIVSLIHIYTLRKSQSISESASANSSDLMLEHPFVVDQTLTSKVEEDLMCITGALPVSQCLNKSALSLDYLSMIKSMCQDEETRQLNSGKRSGRFLHYFDSISFLLEKRTF